MANRTVVIMLAALLSAASFLQAQSDREPVRGQHGMLPLSEIATRVGVDILKKGGNAVDAATAVGLAQPSPIRPPATSAAAGCAGSHERRSLRLSTIENRTGRGDRDMYLNER